MDSRIIKSWIRFVEPNIYNTDKVVILGFGTGQHIIEFQERFPNIEVIVVDPRKIKMEEIVIQPFSSFQYVSTFEGVLKLQASLKYSSLPIPILDFRPCWNPYKAFFVWTEAILKGAVDLQEWHNSPSEFIMESLFI